MLLCMTAHHHEAVVDSSIENSKTLEFRIGTKYLYLSYPENREAKWKATHRGKPCSGLDPIMARKYKSGTPSP